MCPPDQENGGSLVKRTPRIKWRIAGLYGYCMTGGGVPEWLKGADCKSVGAAYPGSNPGSPTSVARLAQSAEHLHGKEGVIGSTPIDGSMLVRFYVIRRGSTVRFR